MFVKKERYKFVSDGNTIFYNFEALFEILGNDYSLVILNDYLYRRYD